MPTLNSIQKLKKDVAIISVSLDRNKELCLKAINRLQMDWVNIINDPIMESVFGNPQDIPQVYLIDKQGKIIYSRTEEKDYDLNKLFTLIKSL